MQMTAWQTHGSYRELHRGASGGTTDPDAFPRLTGALHANAGAQKDRNAQGRDGGLAASHPSEVAGVTVKVEANGQHRHQHVNEIDSADRRQRVYTNRSTLYRPIAVRPRAEVRAGVFDNGFYGSILVKDTDFFKAPSLLTHGWTGSELGMMGLGVYAAYSVLTR